MSGNKLCNIGRYQLQFWHKLPVYTATPMPKFSEGWLTNGKNRYGIKKFVFHGEDGSVVDIEKQMENIQSILMDYERRDIYNMDETGLFWRRSPNCTLSTTAEPGIKQSKERITAMMCGNADGSDKIPMWIIGRAMPPEGT